MVAVLKFFSIFSLTFYFVTEEWWDNGECVGFLTMTHMVMWKALHRFLGSLALGPTWPPSLLGPKTAAAPHSTSSRVVDTGIGQVGIRHLHSMVPQGVVCFPLLPDRLQVPWHVWWPVNQSLPLIQVQRMSWHTDLKITEGPLSPIVSNDGPLGKGDVYLDFLRPCPVPGAGHWKESSADNRLCSEALCLH